MRIKCQYGNPRGVEGEILLQTRIEAHQTIYQQVLGYRLRHISQSCMSCRQSDTQITRRTTS